MLARERRGGFGDPAPAIDGALPQALSGGEIFAFAAVAILAYRFGKAAGAREKQAPSAGAIIAGYFGLRAMDKVFGSLLK